MNVLLPAPFGPTTETNSAHPIETESASNKGFCAYAKDTSFSTNPDLLSFIGF